MGADRGARRDDAARKAGPAVDSCRPKPGDVDVDAVGHRGHGPGVGAGHVVGEHYCLFPQRRHQAIGPAAVLRALAQAGRPLSTVALESIVEDLRTSSVAFEHYDLPKTTRDGDIHEMAGMRGVWFKDPDGSIIGLVNQ